MPLKRHCFYSFENGTGNKFIISTAKTYYTNRFRIFIFIRTRSKFVQFLGELLIAEMMVTKVNKQPFQEPKRICTENQRAAAQFQTANFLLHIFYVQITFLLIFRNAVQRKNIDPNSTHNVLIKMHFMAIGTIVNDFNKRSVIVICVAVMLYV